MIRRMECLVFALVVLWPIKDFGDFSQLTARAFWSTEKGADSIDHGKG